MKWEVEIEMGFSKVTKKDFELFKKFAEKWIEILGLKDWKFYFDLEDIGDNYASYLINREARQVRIRVNEEWPTEDKNSKCIEEYALHELIEVMIHEMRWMAMQRFSYDDVDAETHKIVHTLTRVLLK